MQEVCGLGGSAVHKTYFKEWRKHRGMTQEEAATAMGTSQSVLSGLESGRKGYSRESLEAMARAYRCQVWQLIGHDPSKTLPDNLFVYGVDTVGAFVDAVVEEAGAKKK